jgi:hypothetical protein
LRPIAAETVWTLATAAPELGGVVPPLVAPPSFGWGDRGDHLRPPGHRRAFYVREGEGWRATKGTEPTCDDFPGFVTSLTQNVVRVEASTGPLGRSVLAMSAELPSIEKWPVLEGKVPGAVTLGEALAEAKAACAVQRAAVARYGAPLRLPVPLAVYRLSDDVGERVLAALAPHLGSRAFELTRAICANGLAAYVYRYPSLPLRVAYLEAPDAPLGQIPGVLRRRRDALRLSLDVEQATAGWIRTLARLFALGFVPAHPASVLGGNCLQLQNAVVDGGFCDAGSIAPAAEIRGERALREAVRAGITELARTLLRLHVGRATEAAALADRLPDLFAALAGAVSDELRADPGPVDPRLAEILVERPPGAEAVRRILFALDGE